MAKLRPIVFKKNSLTRVIMFWMALAGLVPFVILAIPEYFFAEQALIDAEKRSLQQALSSRAHLVDGWLKNVRRDLDFISHSNCVQGTCSHACLAPGPDNSCPFQESILKSHPSYRSIQAYDKDLALISRTGDHQNCFKDLSPEQLRLFFADEKDFYISKEHCFEDNRTILTVGMKVDLPDPRKNSYIISNLDLNNAIDFLDHKPFMPSVKFYILSRQGIYLYPPQASSFLHRQKSGLDKTILTSGSERFIEYKDFRQKPVFASFMAVPKTDWLLVKEVDKDVAIRWRLLFASRTALACIACLAIVFGVSLIISRRLTRPLMTLAKTANSISLSDKSAWQPAPDFFYQEIDEVGTAFNEMQKRLRASEKEVIRTASMAAIGNFSSDIVHDIRSPLSSINLSLKSMSKGDNSDADKERIDICLRQAGRLMRMLDQILSYGKPLELYREKLLLSELLPELGDLISGQIREKKISLQIDIDPVEKMPLHVDRELIIQALTNILDNALQWSPAHSLIEIEAYPQPDRPEMIAIRIADNGCGFNPETIDEIFTAFYSKRPKGIGLGLAITKKIIGLHGGTIKAANRKEGGAEILITLPFCAGVGDD
jgi:signal transduction histidine kinase